MDPGSEGTWVPRWGAREGHAVAVDGAAPGWAVEVRAFSQWDPVWGPAIARAGAPTAICGYMTVGLGKYMVSDLRELTVAKGPRWSAQDVDALLDALWDAEQVVPRVEPVLDTVAAARAAFCDNAGLDGPQRTKYLADWVANYEISDLIAAGAPFGDSPDLVFVRTVEREPDTCTHEELARLVDEERFAGVEIFFDSNGARYLPSEFVAAYDADARMRAVYILDVLGHFVLAKPIILHSEDGHASARVLLEINTSSGDYVHKPSVTLLHKVVFAAATEVTDPCLCHAT